MKFKIVLNCIQLLIDVQELREEIERDNHKVVTISNISLKKIGNGKILKFIPFCSLFDLFSACKNKKLKQLIVFFMDLF